MIKGDLLCDHGAVPEHRHSAAETDEVIIVGSHRICLSGVKRLVANKHIAYAVFAVNAQEVSVLVSLYGRWDISVYLICKPGNLNEAAVLLGIVHCA